MTATWAERLASGDTDLRFYVTIQGLADVWQTGAVDLPTTVEAAERTRHRTMSVPRQGGARLDITKRRMIGGSLSFDIDEDDDGTMASLFAPMTRRVTYVAADCTAVAGSVVLKSTSGLPASGLVQIDGEAVVYTGTSGGTTLTGCTRGAYRSRGRPHYGSAENGASVFLTPPSWFGRRVYLFGYFVNLDGTTTSALTSPLGVFATEHEPRFKEGRWTIECNELIDEVFDAKIGRGLREAVVEQPPFLIDYGVAGGFAALPLVGPDAAASGATSRDAINQFAMGLRVTYAMLGLEGSAFGPDLALYALTDVDADTIDLDGTNRIVARWTPGGEEVGRPGAGAKVTSVRHVALLDANFGTIMLEAITSILGDATNGTYDRLPGTERPEFGASEFRFGAGIPEDEVDDASFLAASASTPFVCYPIFKEQALGDMLQEFAIRTGSIIYMTRAGLLTARPLDTTATPSFTINSSNVIPGSRPTVEFDESGINPAVALEMNFNPITDAFMRRHVIFDVELGDRYPSRDEPFPLKLRTAWKDEPAAYGDRPPFTSIPTTSLVDIEAAVRDAQAADGRGRAIVTVLCQIDMLDVELGAIGTITCQVPDLSGNASVTARRCMVVGREPKFDRLAVQLRVMLLDDKVARIAPAAVIQSTASADTVLTLRARAASTFPDAVDTSPGEMFPVGATVRLYDISGATSATATVLVATSTTITISAAPGFAGGIQADVDFVTLAEQAAAGADSANGLDVADFAYMMPDDENDASVIDVTRLT